MRVFTQALFLVQTSFDATYTHLIVSPMLAARYNALLAAAYGMAFGPPLVMTILLAYRIHSIANDAGVPS